MKEVKTSTLKNKALDWAVATVLGGAPTIQNGKILVAAEWLSKVISLAPGEEGELVEFSPSSSYAQGAEMVNNIGIDVRQYKQPPHSIMEARHFDPSKGDELKYVEKFKREMAIRPTTYNEHHGYWYAQSPGTASSVQWIERRMRTDYGGKPYEVAGYMKGETFLLAAMRHLVASMAGLSLSIPARLLRQSGD